MKDNDSETVMAWAINKYIVSFCEIRAVGLMVIASHFRS
jgi:hypothetical protein